MIHPLGNFHKNQALEFIAETGSIGNLSDKSRNLVKVAARLAVIKVKFKKRNVSVKLHKIWASHKKIGQKMEQHGIAATGTGCQENIGEKNRRIGVLCLQIIIELIPFFNERNIRGRIAISIPLQNLFFHDITSRI
jgi:hypothetical protein